MKQEQGCWFILCFCLVMPSAFQSARAEDATRDAASARPTLTLPHPWGEGWEEENQPARHLALLGADRWQAAGYRGQGIKVALVDLGFRGYRALLDEALPARVGIGCYRNDGDFEARNSEHGILCAEVVHTLAPAADLLLATWEPEDSSRFLEAVRWARRQGAQIISCSVITPSWSDGNGGGSFHQALAKLLGDGTAAGDMLCFASSGNTALRHWSGWFHAGADGFHEWKPGLTNNPLKPWGRDRVSVELYGPTGSQYEISVQDSITGLEVGHSPHSSPPALVGGGQGGGRNTFSTVVRFVPKPGCNYQVRVRLTGGQPGFFHLVVLGGSLSWSTAGGSVPCPADGPEVIAVGAVTENGRRPSYSSCGSNFQVPKPDLVAPVPFPLLVLPSAFSIREGGWPRNEGETGYRLRAFSGTSAAAPQAAGLAALIWSRHPEWTARQVRAALIQSAQDIGVPGPDIETGYGMVRLPVNELAIH